MLGIKLEQLGNEIYQIAAERMQECNIPVSLGNLIMNNVVAKFREDALAYASAQAASLDEELDRMREEHKQDCDNVKEGEEDGGHSE